MAEDKRGTKRQCEHCGMKYYDLNRDPILCPGCQEPYVEPVEPTPRKSKPADDAPETEETKSSEVESDPAAAEAGVETVSFEDVESGDDDSEANEVEPADDIADVEGVEDIGGEVDNSFVDDGDDDGAQDNYGLNTAKDDE